MSGIICGGTRLAPGGGAFLNGKQFLDGLVANPERRRSVRWDDLVTALPQVGFVVKPTAHGAIVYHPAHPRRAFQAIGRPHSKSASSETVKVGYINGLCDYLEELQLSNKPGDENDVKH